MGGRGSGSKMSSGGTGINRQQARDYMDSSTEGQINYAIKWGYKDQLVNAMVDEATAEGYTESKPKWSSDGGRFDSSGNVIELPSNAYRTMTINGTGRLKEHTAQVFVTEDGPQLYISDGWIADTISFSDSRSGLSRAIKSGKRFVETKDVSSRKDGFDLSKFMVRR